jgi:S-methylmethionine-dependent homocysteine/selenocysteine methylase
MSMHEQYGHRDRRAIVGADHADFTKAAGRCVLTVATQSQFEKLRGQ